MTKRETQFEVIFFAVVLLLFGALAFFRLGFSDLGADEGRFGVAALNVLADHRQIAILSHDPLGDPATMPFVYPISIAIAISLMGPNEFAIRSVNVIALVVGAFLLYSLVESLIQDSLVSKLSFLFFLLNPGTLTYARVAVPEALVVCWGCAGLLAAVKFYRTNRWPWAALAGVALGAAFLSKLWLVGPFVLACAVLLAAKINFRSLGSLPGPALAGACFLLVASSHLLLVAVWAPDFLSHWRDIYYIFTLKSRLAGEGYDPAMWHQPWWFYWGTAFKATFFGLPLVFLGALSARKLNNRVVMGVLLALSCPLVIFSFFQVKQATYIFPAYPALAILLALGGTGLYRGSCSQLQVAAASLAAAGVSVIFYGLAVVSLHESSAIVVFYFLFFLASLSLRKRPLLVKGVLSLAVVSALLVADVIVVRRSLTHRTYYREIASYLGDHWQSTRPQDRIFVAPEFPAMQFYTFRRGEYWETFYFHKSTGEFLQDVQKGNRLFYVVDENQTLYGSVVSPEKLQIVLRHTSEVTPALEDYIGHKIPVRVFVARAEKENRS